MKHDTFFDKCRHLASSVEPDQEKNLRTIKTKLLTEKEEETIAVLRPKKARRLALVAIALSAVLFTFVAAAAIPMIWRNVNATIYDGDQYVESLIAQISEDGTHGMISAGLTADAGRVVIDVDGSRMVFNDGLQAHDLDEARSILQFNHLLLPTYLPDGFVISAFSFPTSSTFDPDNIFAMDHMTIVHTNTHDEIVALIIQASEGDFELTDLEARTFRSVEINGIEAFVGDDRLILFDANHGMLYHFSASPGVEEAILIRMAESMQ